VTVRGTEPAPEGVLLIDKPSGMTSHDVVDAVRRALGTRKVGHAGTLDPMATGLLVLGVGRATRLLRFLGDLPKTYEGVMRLGVETDTLDAEGEVVRTSEVDVTRDDVAAAMAELTGESSQRPPAYSAVKVAGRRLYEAARAGEVIEADPRPIRVDAFELLAIEGAEAGFRVVCSGGTYVRVLAADVGARLGCGAHLTRLRRTSIGTLRVADATSPDSPGEPLPLETAVSHLPHLALDEHETDAAIHGRVLAPAAIEGPYAVTGPDGRLIGIYRDEGSASKPEMILATA
jgi:tRNA pseudouridine55 synthase